jgi:hypothetical protein
MPRVYTPPARVRLRGTTRQAAWANTVRAPLLNEVDAIRDATVARLRGSTVTAEEAMGYEAILVAADGLAREDRAAWWIDHRGHSAFSLLLERTAGAVDRLQRTAAAAPSPEAGA